MATNINKIIYGGNVLVDLTGDTVTAADLAYGVKAHDNSGTQITGTSTKDLIQRMLMPQPQRFYLIRQLM